jgi:hypothetical protein
LALRPILPAPTGCGRSSVVQGRPSCGVSGKAIASRSIGVVGGFWLSHYMVEIRSEGMRNTNALWIVTILGGNARVQLSGCPFKTRPKEVVRRDALKERVLAVKVSCVSDSK